MNIRAFYLRNLFWLNDIMTGGRIRKQYDEIRYLNEHSFEKGDVLRRKAFANLVAHAKSHTAFYRNSNFEYLRDFPVMNKALYIEKYDQIKVPESCIPWQEGPMLIQKTSGSTGTPFAVPQDTRKRNRRIAELKYYGKIVGFDSHEKLIQLRAWNKYQFKTKNQANKENIVPFDISKMSDEDLSRLFSLIYSENAICIRSYATSFRLIADYARRHQETCAKKNHLRISIAGSEMLEDDIRPLVKKYLGCDIISQYADEECGILAQEKIPTQDSNNLFYLNHASYIFEILKFDSNEPAEFGELGRIVITDLYNYAFPIIRYDTGDIGKFEKPNEYSNGYPVLAKLYGRRYDLIYTTDCSPIHPITFGRELKHYSEIVQWQFIQKAEKEYILNVQLRANKLDEEDVINQLKNIVGSDSEIAINYVDDIPVLSSGKRKPVVNEWKNGK